MRDLERGYQKYAWLLLFGLGILGLIFAMWDMFSGFTDDPQSVRALTGRTWGELVAENPGVAKLVLQWVRAAGIGALGFSILAMAMAVTGYRTGERWTWYALWSVPTVIVGFIVNNLSVGGSLWPIFIVFLVVALAGLLLPIRKFFPRSARRT